LIIARLCGLTEGEMFKLVEMELVKRKSKS